MIESKDFVLFIRFVVGSEDFVLFGCFVIEGQAVVFFVRFVTWKEGQGGYGGR